MTKIFEYREIKKKQLIFEFRFDRNENYISKNGNHVCTLDKYMSLDNWIDVYNKLSRRIDKYVSNTEQPPAADSTVIRHAQLELSISFKKLSKQLPSLIGLADNPATYPHSMCVHIRAVSKVADYIDLNPTGQSQVSPDKANTHGKNSSPKIEPVNADTSNGTDKDEEYVPDLGLVDKNNLLSLYTPAKTIQLNTDSIIEYIPHSDGLNTEFDSNAYRPLKKSQKSEKPSGSQEDHTAIQQFEISSLSDEERDQMPKSDYRKPSKSATSSKPMLTRKLSQQSPLKRNSDPDADRLPRTPLSKRSKPNDADSEPADLGGTTIDVPYILCDSLAEDEFKPASPLKKYKSNHNKDGNELLRTPRSNRNKLDTNIFGSNEKPNKSQDMFGSSSDDDDLPPHCTKADRPLLARNAPQSIKKDHFVTKRLHLDRKAKIGEKDYDKGRPSLASTSTPKMRNQNIAKWLSKDSGRSNSDAKDKINNNDKTERKKKVDKSKRQNVNEKDIQEMIAKENEQHQQKMDRYKELQCQMDEINKPVTVDRIIDLKDMPVSDIIKTFEKHKDLLQEKFDIHLGQQSRKVKHASDYEYITMHTMMVQQQVHKMVDKLRTVFIDGLNPVEVCLKQASKSERFVTQMQCHQLFWELLIPEWILAIFMDSFDMTRDEAVKHIHDQDKVLIQDSNSFEIP